jgi:hypothetical protein
LSDQASDSKRIRLHRQCGVQAAGIGHVAIVRDAALVWQQNVTCVKADTSRVPPGVGCVVFDRGVCIFGDATMLGAIQTELRRELVIPDDCALVFTEEVLTGAGRLAPECLDALSQLHRLPLAAEVKERLRARTEQPMPTLWMAVEQAIQARISARRSVCRFDLARGIDWTTLDCPASNHAD